MRVAVIGLGKLGLPVACSFAQVAETVGVDLNSELVETIQRGGSPYDEPGLQDLLAENAPEVGTDFSVVQSADVIILIVPTPSLHDGTFSNEFIVNVIREISPYLIKDQTIVISSTVMPETCTKVFVPLIESLTGKRVGVDLGLIYSPEFIALGSVLRDLHNPDLILIGSVKGTLGNFHAERYEMLIRRIVPEDTPVFHLSTVDAEISKLAINTFLNVKTTFINTIAALCSKTIGSDVGQIAEAISADSRIGSKFLMPGAPAGGTCLPRDLRAIRAMMEQKKVPEGIPNSLIIMNNFWFNEIVQRVSDHLLPGKTLGVLGLAYKPGTPVMEESFGAAVADFFAESGSSYVHHREPVVVYDPKAECLPRANVTVASSAQECVDKSDVVVICTPDPEFVDVNLKNRTTIDVWGIRKKMPFIYRPGRSMIM